MMPIRAITRAPSMWRSTISPPVRRTLPPAAAAFKEVFWAMDLPSFFSWACRSFISQFEGGGRRKPVRGGAMKNLFIVLIAAAFVNCGTPAAPKPPSKAAATDGFCGSSTKGACQSDADCHASGCSGQICQSKKEEGQISVCDYKECYDAAKYGLKCGCVDQGCQWREASPHLPIPRHKSRRRWA